MKLKTVEFKRVETETDLELPVYFYFQDEMCNDELIKFDGERQIKITYNSFGFKIDSTSLLDNIHEHHLNSITSKEHFNEVMKYAIDYIKKQM